MALTEEEKKKKMQQDISLDEWYNTNQQNIERQAQQQYEDAYVNRELMNKYLNQNLASQGLADTGIANLYAQQANTNYMNERANIANVQQEAETNLFNQYYTQKKAENDAYSQKLYDLYSGQIGNSVNSYGFIDEDARNKLSESIDWDSLNASDRSLLEAGLNMYAGTDEQIKTKAQDELFNEFSTSAGQMLGDNNKKYGEIGLYVDQVENLLNQYTQAYNEGRLTLEQKDALEGYLNQYKINRKENTNLDITENVQNEIEKNTVDANEQLDKKYLENNFDFSKGKLDINNSVNIWDDNITSSNFGNFIGNNNIGSNQNKYVAEIIKMARNNEFDNGDVIEFNYGASEFNQSWYMYYEGKFYKVEPKISNTYPAYSSTPNTNVSPIFAKKYIKPQKVKNGLNLLK